MRKKLFGILLSAFMLVTLLPATVFAEAQKIYDSNVTWELKNNNSELVIDGIGAMPDFDSELVKPWEVSMNTLTKASFGSSVTNVGGRALMSFSNLQSVSLSASITVIGEKAFYASSVTDITINATTPPTLGSDAFKNCGNLASIYVPASSVDTYKAATGWSSYADKIKPLINTIADIMPDNFPATKNDGWVNSSNNNATAYVGNNGTYNFVYFEDVNYKVGVNYIRPVTKNGNNYVYGAPVRRV